MTIEYPARIELARTPTPLEKLARTSAALGVEVWIKRDDLTGAELSGNKIRKLEFLFADAMARGADTVITGGGEQSNHCRATALAATRLGLRSVVLLRTADPGNPPTTRGNILLDRLAGAEIVWISPDEWQRRGEIFVREAERVKKAGHKAYVIPEGGSNAIGSWGYVVCAEEIDAQLAARPDVPTTVIHACGSGGTAAGLVIGARELSWSDRNIRVASVNVCDDRDYFVDVIGRICRGMRDDPEIEGEIDIVDGYVGDGYARSRPQELEQLVAMARREAVILDPVYTGKAWFGLVSELAKDRERFGQRVVFVHTGGIFGLFPAAERIFGSGGS